jgi:hypothetical protein
MRPFLTLFAISSVALAGLAGLFHSFDNRAEADSSSGDTRTEDESPNLDHPLPVEVTRQPGERPLRQRSPFAPYPAHPGALAFDDLGAEERAEVEAMQEWAEADSGYHVHEAYRRATTFGVRRARARSAERDVGLVGAASLGVK